MKKSLYHIPGSYKLLFYFYLCINLLPCKICGQEVKPKPAQATDYVQIFGNKYASAITFLYDNHWIWDSLKTCQVDPAFAVAIVFPELIRYSAIRDKIEKGGLFSLYIYYGEKYANFSVGEFQMKPSFARQLEEDISKLPRKIVKTYQMLNNRSNTQEARKERVKRLDNIHWQVRYLALFIQIMDQRHKNTKWTSEEEKLRFYATAYNFGYTKPSQDICAATEKKYFHLGWASMGECYCYADISVSYAYNPANSNY